MKRNIRKIDKILAGYIGLTLVICLVLIGASVKANNDSIVFNNATVNINNQSMPEIPLEGNFGAAGGMLAENYISYIMYNGGFNTAKPMTLQSTLDVTGAATFASTLGLTGAITSSGANTFSGANAFSATSTFTGNLQAARIYPGGGIYASSTSKALTLAASTVCDNTYIAIQFVSSTADTVAITLPATSSVSSYCLKTAGQSLDFQFANTNLFASTTSWTGNTDYTMNFTASTTGALSTALPAGARQYVRCWRLATKYSCDIFSFKQPVQY